MITILVYLMLYHDHNHDPRGRSLPLHGLHLRLRTSTAARAAHGLDVGLRYCRPLPLHGLPPRLRPALPPVPLMILVLASDQHRISTDYYQTNPRLLLRDSPDPDISLPRSQT